jgi:hypothetical protein
MSGLVSVPPARLSPCAPSLMKVVHFEVQAMNNIHAKAFRMSSLIGGRAKAR